MRKLIGRNCSMKILVNKNSSCYHHEEILIDAPLELIYETIADINQWPGWQSDVNETKIEGKTEEGKIFKWKANGMNIISKLHTVKLYSEIGWTGKILWIKAVHNWYFKKENNLTRVIVEESLQGIGSALLKNTLIEGVKKNLKELKKKVELQSVYS